jgi:hypothetical protein
MRHCRLGLWIISGWVVAGATVCAQPVLTVEPAHVGIGTTAPGARLDVIAVPGESAVRGIANGGGVALTGIVNSGAGIAIKGYSVSTASPAIVGESVGYYAGLFYNITDLGSNLANASAIGLVSQSLYSNALYAQQGGAPGSPGDTLARDNVYPAAYVTRVGALNGHDYAAPVVQIEDVTASTGPLLELVKQGTVRFRASATGLEIEIDGALLQVQVGAADSAGPGKRFLIVNNAP